MEVFESTMQLTLTDSITLRGLKKLSHALGTKLTISVTADGRAIVAADGDGAVDVSDPEKPPKKKLSRKRLTQLRAAMASARAAKAAKAAKLAKSK